MNLLGIDYGKVYLGLALASDKYPKAFKVIKSKSDIHKISVISDICSRQNIDKIIIGYGSDSLKNDINNFIVLLKNAVVCQIEKADESFSSNIAVEDMITDRVSRKRRKIQEHAYAAKNILENYLQNLYLK